VEGRLAAAAQYGEPRWQSTSAHALRLFSRRRAVRLQQACARQRLLGDRGTAVTPCWADVSIPRDVGDFRIIGRRVIEQLRMLPEGHGFLRDLVAFVGFRQTAVEYDRHARRAHGKGNYSRYIGSLRIGINGLIGFSNFLLFAIMAAGLLISVISALIAFYIIFAKLVLNQPFPFGIPAVIVLILFMGGTILIALSIVGIYVGHIYDEVKRRPQFIIDRVVNVPALSSDIVPPPPPSQDFRNISAANGDSLTIQPKDSGWTVLSSWTGATHGVHSWRAHGRSNIARSCAISFRPCIHATLTFGA
jgi:hypothetical protein